MLRTVEVRWFFPGEVPLSVRAWFKAAAPTAVNEPLRVDYYLKLADQNALGVKVRAGRLEAKKRKLSMGSRLFHTKVVGQLESWVKWGHILEEINSKPANQFREMWIAVAKERQMVSFIMSKGTWRARGGKLGLVDQGCEIELSKVQIDSRIWWTFAFEAPGTPDQGKSFLIDVSELFFASHDPPPLPLDKSYGYPHWINQVI